MENLLIVMSLLLISMCGALVAFRAGKEWMLAYIAAGNAIMMFVGLAQIQVLAHTLFINTVLFGVNFYITDLMEEYYGKHEARKLIWIIVGTQLAMIGVAYLVLLAPPAPTDEFFPALQLYVQHYAPLLVIIAVSNAILQFIDTWLYAKIRAWTQGHFLWLRNNGSTLTTMAIDSFIVIPLAIPVVFPDMSMDVVWSIAASSFILKVIVALLDTPFMYLSRFVRPRELRG